MTETSISICPECENKIILDSGKYICSNCGLVIDTQLIASKAITFQTDTTTNTVVHNNKKGSYIFLNECERHNKKLQKISRNHNILLYTEKAKDSNFFRTFDNICTNIKVNQKIKILICEIAKKIREKTHARISNCIISAIIYYYYNNKIMSLTQIASKLKVKKTMKYFRLLEKSGYKIHKDQKKAKIYNLIHKLFEDKEFNRRLQKLELEKKQVQKNVFDNINNELNKFQDHRTYTTQVIARAIYNILKKQEKKLITQRIISKIAGVSEYTIREQKKSLK